MSGYASAREVREVTEATLQMEGRDPADYNVAGIVRDAFTYSGGRWSAFGMAEEWRAAVERHRRRQALEVHGAPGLTLADLHTVARAARAHLAGRAAETGPREWGDPALAQKYAVAMRGAQVWLATGGVHAHIPGPSWQYAASEALDAGSNAITWRGAAYIAERDGAAHLYFGLLAARELGNYHRAHGDAPFGDLAGAGSGDLMAHLGETSPTTEGNHAYRAGLVEAYALALAGPAPVLADAGAA
jgi:hypothetical protein